MPERMRLIRNRAEAIYSQQNDTRSSFSPSRAAAGSEAGPIPAEVRHQYFELAENELIAEGKIARRPPT